MFDPLMQSEYRLTDEVLQLIYGRNVDTRILRNVKSESEIWDDLFLFLSNNDITKIAEIKRMNIMTVFNLIESRLKGVPRLKKEHKEIRGFNAHRDENQ